jgi:hypothetical protein
MIGNPGKTQRLLSDLQAALPLETRIGPQLAVLLRDKMPDLKPFQRCQVTKVFYTGDEGGILCHLDLTEDASEEVYLTSITHLVFDPRLPLARQIAAYQKHRIKGIRREAAATEPLAFRH